jgi:FMN-dependent oxidoreductase (nitrilotriacetate monooxygenase family)
MAGRDDRKMVIGWLMAAGGAHRAAWMKHVGQPDPHTTLAAHVGMARDAERAKLDFIFHADWPSVRPGSAESIARNCTYANHLEPIALMTALAVATSHVGLVATVTTSFSEPYNVARQFASLDHLSQGRAGWNIVTGRSPMAAFNFGHTSEIPHAERYRRGEEFVEVALGLWDSYEDDAFIRDPKSGFYFDPTKMHVLNHEGKYFRVRGPLNIARPPQGRPVLFQAGASDTGMSFGAKFGELLFANNKTIEAAQGYYRTVRENVAGCGRSPSEVLVCNGLEVIVRDSAAEAEDAYQELEDLLHPEAIKDSVAVDIEADISDLGADDLLTVDRLPISANSSKSSDKVIRGWLEKEPMTVRQLYKRFGSRGAHAIYGTPKQVADRMEEWFTAGATDGFMMFFPLPTGMRDFGTMVVPELQRRSLFRSEYIGKTFRENLGLRRPPHRMG